MKMNFDSNILCWDYLQKRVLNTSRGPAVRALRAQTDKREYASEMKKVVERQVGLTALKIFLKEKMPVVDVTGKEKAIIF